VESGAVQASFLPTDTLCRLLIDAARDYAIFALDPDGTIASWNVGAERIKGYTAAEAVGRPFAIFYPPDAVSDGLPARLLASARSSGRVQDEGWRVRKDGTMFWADVVVTALRDRSGQLVGYSKITRDVTEWKRAEAELRSAKEAAEAALAQIRQLRRLLPICSYCKRVRDDKAYWHQVEEYISAHTDVRFSHGICPDCFTRIVRPQLDEIDPAPQG